ncbi:HEAT repeat domain-containing protein [Thiolapillus sp.]
MTTYRETVDTLCQLVQTGDEADRCYAARTLGLLRDTASIETLIEHLRDEDLDVAIDAAEALGNIGSAEAVPALIESLENDPSGEVCTMVAVALGKIGSTEAIDPLLKICLERPQDMEWNDDWDTWWDVQKAAVHALGKLGAETAVDSLAALIDDECQQDMEPDILNALIRMGGSGEAKVIKRLQNPDSASIHRRRAAHALARSSSVEATKALGRALTDPAADVRAEAALSLASQNAVSYLSALTLLLRDPDNQVRQAALKAVTRLAQNSDNAPNVEEAFQGMLADPDPEVRAILYSMLLPVVPDNPLSEENFQRVLERISDPSAEAAAAACALLGANRNTAAISPLLEIVSDSSAHPMVRKEAATAIGSLGRIDVDVLSTLENTITDEQQVVRLAALEALMELEKTGLITPPDDEEAPLPRPLDLIMGALNGEITIPQPPPPAPVEVTLDTGIDKGEAPQADSENPPEETDTIAETAESDLDLPQTPAQIVAEGEVAPAMSTLDAIHMANVETMLATPHAPEEMADETTMEYLEIVAHNKELMRRMRSNRRIDAQQDIRRLAAHVLAETNEEEALKTLIQALNDDAAPVRREAADSIGLMAKRNPQLAGLTDAVGTLITQLAIGDLDQKITSARALSYIGHRAALVPLLEALKAPEFTLRTQAIDALARLSLNSRDPAEADHMVVRDVPPLSVARRLMECLEDNEMAVRVAAARGLARILKPLREESFTRKAVEKIVDGVTIGTGEEARLIGRALREFDTDLANSILLANLKQADDSVKRSVYIEMIEELLTVQDHSEQAA